MKLTTVELNPAQEKLLQRAVALLQNYGWRQAGQDERAGPITRANVVERALELLIDRIGG